MSEFKKIFLITYFLKKRDLSDRSIQELASAIFNARKDLLFPLLVTMNKYTFFGTIGEVWIQKLVKSDPDRQEKLINSFDLVRDIIGCRGAKLSKKDVNLISKLFQQEVQAFGLFFENYMLLDLPVTTENIDSFKRDKSEKIYRYKREVEINDKIYNVLDILNKKKGKIIAKEYRLEKLILFPTS
jgi:hypothetical protein